MEEKEPIVISLGGSFIFNKSEELKELKRVIDSFHRNVTIVVGGGRLCRDYISFAKYLGLSTNELHIVGIKATILNAFVISRALKYKFYNGSPDKTPKKGVNVMGGFYGGKYRPGNTTDVVAAIAAISVNSKTLLNLSKEKGVYDKDPEKHKNAKLLKKISFDTFLSKTKNARKPGMNFIFDPKAARMCKKANIRVIVTSDLKDIKKVLNKEEVNGTVLS